MEKITGLKIGDKIATYQKAYKDADDKFHPAEIKFPKIIKIAKDNSAVKATLKGDASASVYEASDVYSLKDIKKLAEIVFESATNDLGLKIRIWGSSDDMVPYLEIKKVTSIKEDRFDDIFHVTDESDFTHRIISKEKPTGIQHLDNRGWWFWIENSEALAKFITDKCLSKM